MNNKGQLDFDDISIPGIVFGLVGAGIGIIVAKQAGATVFFRILSGIVCAISCYFIGGRIASD